MCGLVAKINKFEKVTDNSEFFDLLFIDQFRGMDGTGVFYPNDKGKVVVHKEVGGMHNLMRSVPNLHKSSSTAKWMVGHNRKATMGANNKRNSHPFVSGDFTLVHNGTLLQHDNLTKEKVAVDSEAIVKSMYRRGEKTTLEDIKGAFALIWYNAKEGKLKLARNGQRSLWICEMYDAVYICSEKEMLEFVLNRHYKHSTKKEYTNVETYTIYSWDEQKKVFDKEDFNLPGYGYGYGHYLPFHHLPHNKEKQEEKKFEQAIADVYQMANHKGASIDTTVYKVGNVVKMKIVANNHLTQQLIGTGIDGTELKMHIIDKGLRDYWFQKGEISGRVSQLWYPKATSPYVLLTPLFSKLYNEGHVDD